MTSGLVSIIMPVYNAETYLLQSINSVLNQSYSKIELIIINDGSTDGTMDILNSVKDTRVKCYNIPNGGPAKARNYGLKKALGEYIQFIDADDYLDQDGVEILVSKVNNCDMVIAGYRIVGKDIYNIQIVNIEDEGCYTAQEIANRYLDLFETQTIRHLWNKLYLRDIIEKWQMKFNENLKRGEGIVFNVNYLKYARKVYLIERPIYNYYVENEDSLTSIYLPDFIKYTDTVFTEINKYLNDLLKKDMYIYRLRHLYIDRMINYIALLFRAKNLSGNDIIYREINAIVHNDMFINAIDFYKPPTKKARVLKMMMKNKMTRLIYLYYLIRNK